MTWRGLQGVCWRKEGVTMENAGFGRVLRKKRAGVRMQPETGLRLFWEAAEKGKESEP